MKLHPLLNEKSPHYGLGKDAAIYKMFKEYDALELLAWCKLNAVKYKERRGKKQGESAAENDAKYKSFYYTALLLDCYIFSANELAGKILSGKINEVDLITARAKLSIKPTHSCEELTLLEILNYMARS